MNGNGNGLDGVTSKDTPESSSNGNGTGVQQRTQFQYQRAYALSKELRDTLYLYSAEQIQQIREQNALVQRAAATAQSFSEIAASSYDAAQSKVHALSDTMLTELQKVQVRLHFS